MAEPAGTIISSHETPTPAECQFVLNQPIKKGHFIEFDTEEGRAIARVANVIKTNRYFMQAESVSEYEKAGVSLDTVLPIEDWEYLVGEAQILGVYNDNGLIKRPSFPPSPGTEIFLAEEERLENFLGLDPENGLHLGDVQFHDLKASFNLTKMLQKHLSILAQTGAGKSYLAAVMLEELLDREPGQGQVAVVVIDPHGEYSGFAEDKGYMDRVKVYNGKDIQIGMPSLYASHLDQYFHDVSAAQKREMDKVLNGLRDNGVYGLQDVQNAVENRDMNQSTKEVWLDRLRRMQYMHLFKRYDNPGMDKIEAGKMVIFDLSDIVDRQKKQIITAYFTSKLFRARRDNDIPPFFLLVEEAHNFIPEGTSSSDAPARSVMRKIAREGRKFHACLGLISQRPARLDQTTLSQCNTNIILRVTNPNDLDRIKQGSEGITSDVLQTIPGLRVGECILVGEAVKYPTFVDVRKRHTHEFDSGKSLEDASKDFSGAQQAADEDAEAFT